MTRASFSVCGAEDLAPGTASALQALADAALRRVQREKAAATRHRDRRRKKERERKALVRHIKRSRAS